MGNTETGTGNEKLSVAEYKRRMEMAKLHIEEARAALLQAQAAQSFQELSQDGLELYNALQN